MIGKPAEAQVDASEYIIIRANALGRLANKLIGGDRPFSKHQRRHERNDGDTAGRVSVV